MSHKEDSMASKVTIQKAGGASVTKDGLNTVADAKAAVGAEDYTATVNGRPAEDGQMLSDFDYVGLAKPVKAG